MKKQIFSLMLSAVFLTTLPLLAMESDPGNKGNHPTRLPTEPDPENKGNYPFSIWNTGDDTDLPATYYNISLEQFRGFIEKPCETTWNPFVIGKNHEEQSYTFSLEQKTFALYAREGKAGIDAAFKRNRPLRFTSELNSGGQCFACDPYGSFYIKELENK